MCETGPEGQAKSGLSEAGYKEDGYKEDGYRAPETGWPSAMRETGS